MALSIPYQKMISGTVTVLEGLVVAISGDGLTLLTGSNVDGAGRVDVWTFAAGVWTYQDELVPTDLAGTQSLFGNSIALSYDGNTAIVGAPKDNAPTSGSTGVYGAAFIFVRSGTAWSQQGSKLLPSPTNTQTATGSGVAITPDGDRVAVGDSQDNDNGASLRWGATYIFERSGSTWGITDKIIGNVDLLSNGQAGYSVAFDNSGETLIVGAPGDLPLNTIQHSTVTVRGSATVYRLVSGTWGIDAFLQRSADLQTALAGRQVALSGDGLTAAVGGLYWDFSGTPVFGEALTVYASTAGSWAFESAITPSDSPFSTFFGTWPVAVDQSGDHLVTGVGLNNSGFSADGPGAAWTFTRSAGSWSQDAPAFVPVDVDGNAMFGTSAAMTFSGLIVVGGPGDGEGGSLHGAAWAFLGGVTASYLSLDGIAL